MDNAMAPSTQGVGGVVMDGIGVAASGPPRPWTTRSEEEPWMVGAPRLIDSEIRNKEGDSFLGT
jgi:hypothetical protein